MIDFSKFDKTKFNTIPFALKDTTKPWGHEIIFTENSDPYTGKLIYLNAGKKFSLQVHDEKQETQMLISGQAKLYIDNEKGAMVVIDMEPQKGYRLVVGQRHRVEAITDICIVEVSTPETGTTYRLEDDYKRPDQTEELRTKERTEL